MEDQQFEEVGKRSEETKKSVSQTVDMLFMFVTGFGCLFLVLVGGCSGYQLGQADERSRTSQIEADLRQNYVKEVAAVQKQLHIEAVANGYGTWEVSSRGSVEFKWKPIK